jgi:hypothetical protein
MTLRIRGRAAAPIAGLVLGAALLGGCESQGADTSCSVDSCTVTFDRSADAKASVLGVEAKLIGVEGDQVTVEVAGQQVTLTAGQAATQVGDFQVSLEKVDDKQVTIKIARGGG